MGNPATASSTARYSGTMLGIVGTTVPKVTYTSGSEFPGHQSGSPSGSCRLVGNR